MRRELGHMSSAAWVLWAHPLSALPVRASGNAVPESCYFSGDIVKISSYQTDYDRCSK